MKVELWKIISTVVVTALGFIFSGFKVYNSLDNRILKTESNIKNMNIDITNNKKECDKVHKKLEDTISNAQSDNSLALKEVSDKINIALVGIARIEGYMKGHQEISE